MQCRRPQLYSWVGKIPRRRDRLPTPVFLGFPGGSDGKESACNVGDPGSIPGWARSPGEGNGNPLQYSCLENPMDRGAWRATVHRVAESDTTEWLRTALHGIITWGILCRGPSPPHQLSLNLVSGAWTGKEVLNTVSNVGGKLCVCGRSPYQWKMPWTPAGSPTIQQIWRYWS